MKRLIFFLISCLLSIRLNAQMTAVNLIVFQNRIKISDSIRVELFLYDTHTNLLIKEGILFIPDSLLGKKVDLKITTNNHELMFDNLFIYWNKEYLYWIVNIDFPPFDKNKNWDIKDKLKRVKWIYSIDRGNGTSIKYYGRKPLRK